MGASGSIATPRSIRAQLEKLPESCDAATAEDLLGYYFDPIAFEELKINGKVEKSKLIAYYERLLKSSTTASTSPTSIATVFPIMATTDATAASAYGTFAADSSEIFYLDDETEISIAVHQYAPDTTRVHYKTLHSILRWNKATKRKELKRILATDAGAVVRSWFAKCRQQKMRNKNAPSDSFC